uniref:Peptidase S1 domain-containing protein n=1 Tax=Acrobeloides nanus TaxID=290746 RepID=A0A914EM59_9BILA
MPKDDTALISKANTIAGWGYWSLDSRYCGDQTTNIIRNNSEILVKTTVPVINNVNCQLYYPDFNTTTIYKDTLCAGTDFNGASTNNDWATPLMVASSNGVWFQTGIFSSYISYGPELLAQGAQTCGTRSGNFTQKYGNGIIAGCYAQQGEFPWEGLLELYNASGALIQFCGVTLLSQQYALTSAVCIEIANRTNVTHIIRFGMLNRTDYSVPNNSISQAWVNPAFNLTSLLHNIGLIKLTLNVTYNTNIQPICIAKNDSALISHANTVAGWGYWSLNSQYCGNQTTGYSNTNSQILIKTTVPIINNVLCQ